MKSTTKTITSIAMMIALLFVMNALDKVYSQWLVAISGASLAVCVLVATALFAFLYNDIRYAIAGGISLGLVSFLSSYLFISPLFQNPLISLLPRAFVGIIGFGAYKAVQVIMRKMCKLVTSHKIHLVFMIIVDLLVVAGIVVFCVYVQSGWVFFLIVSLSVIFLILCIAFTIAIAVRDNEAKLARVGEQVSLTIATAFVIIANTGLVLPMMYFFGGAYETLADVFMVSTILNFIPEVIVTPIVAPIVIMAVRKGMRLGIDGKALYKVEKEIASN